MLFGAHVSVAGGYLKALDYAESVGCECMQIFAKSPRQWRGSGHRPATPPQEFVAERPQRGFGPVFTHTAYLINLATDDPALLREVDRRARRRARERSALGAQGSSATSATTQQVRRLRLPNEWQRRWSGLRACR